MTQRLRILHLEDDPHDAELIRLTLEADGVEAELVRVDTRAAFLAALGQPDFTLILCDYAMPGFDGAAALALAATQRPDLPFLFVSGAIGEERAIESLKRGATDYVLKERLTRLAPAVCRAMQEATTRAERQRAETALRLSKERYRQISETISDYAFAYHVEADGTLVLDWLTESFSRITGRPVEELLGKSNAFRAYVHPDDMAQVMAMLKALRGEVATENEFRLITAAGEIRWMQAVLRAVAGPTGALTQVYGAARDITARKATEAALATEAQIGAALGHVGQELLRALEKPTMLDQLCQLATVTLDATCGVMFLWQPARHGYAPVANWQYALEQSESVPVLQVPQLLAAGLVAQIEGDTVLELTLASPPNLQAETVLHPLDLTSAFCIPLRRGAELVGVQVCGYRGQGRGTASQVRVAQGIAQLGSLALANVMTLEELERANRLKDDFLSTMSHELRTPLQSVLGFTDLVLESAFGPLTAQQSTALQKVKKAANRELKLINSMLEVSQLGMGRLPVVRQAVDVAALMEELREEALQLPTKPTLGLEWRIPPALPQLHTDRMKLNIVLQNLLSNAVKFTEQGGVIVDVHPSDGGMEFCISDTGIGITPEVQRVMFEMFRQGDGSSTRRHEGVGLGLYVVQRMVDILEGTVAVESEAGRGSTFRVWVPTLEAAPH